jgi:hypothetical protein
MWAAARLARGGTISCPHFVRARRLERQRETLDLVCMNPGRSSRLESVADEPRDLRNRGVEEPYGRPCSRAWTALATQRSIRPQREIESPLATEPRGSGSRLDARDARTRYGLTPGTQVEFVDEAGTLRLVVRRRVTPSDPARGYGMAKGPPRAGPGALGLRCRRSSRPAAPENAGMIAVDTNVLARFYCDDPDDPEAVGSGYAPGG